MLGKKQKTPGLVEIAPDSVVLQYTQDYRSGGAPVHYDERPSFLDFVQQDPMCGILINPVLQYEIT